MGAEKNTKKSALNISSIPKKEILRILQKELKPSRYTHTLGVMETAQQLAQLNGIDTIRCEYAAMLHDCAKSLPTNSLIELINKSGFVIDELELKEESVLHAPAGAQLAKIKYGITDEDILSAIRKHTIGDPEMSCVDAVIYTADFIEPARKSFEGLKEARKTAFENLWAGMVCCAELTRQFLKSQGKDAHPKTIQMIERYKGGFK